MISAAARSLPREADPRLARVFGTIGKADSRKPLLSGFGAADCGGTGSGKEREKRMEFKEDRFTAEERTIQGETIRFRAYRNLTCVNHPVVPGFHILNLFVPEVYYEGGERNGYSLKTAPVFLPNSVGGYLPGPAEEPGYQAPWARIPNSLFRALQHGYVVASPAIRGRTQQDESGRYVGKAPACIIDYKAAVRYLHFWQEELPGDESKIITNGTSAGGALSSLMGAAGNHPDYAPYLEKLGAAEAGDEVYAASCYCPITNLEHADMAYEWQLEGIHTCFRNRRTTRKDGTHGFIPERKELTEQQIAVSAELKKQFSGYVSGLNLRDEQGVFLTLDENGEGPFRDHLKSIVLASAQQASDQGTDVSEKKWLVMRDGQAVDMDFRGYVEEITRMKEPPAFDSLTLDSPENSLFGTENTDRCHFTEFAHTRSGAEDGIADSKVIRMLNPMNYINAEEADTARYWRIRHGECDRDTSLAVSALLTAKLRNSGAEVDYWVPWNTPHSGDYDLDELFAWIDGICR